MSAIKFKRAPRKLHTAYLQGGGTRMPGGDIPHLSIVRTVGQFEPDDHRWELAPGALEALERTCDDWEKEGGEPVRMTDMRRMLSLQQLARAGYEAWDRAGRPDYGSSGWRVGMRSDYVARPGESNHNAGLAIDIDTGSLLFPGCKRGSDEALAEWWRVSGKHGWTPVIDEPDSSRSERWHFDHLGPLAAVRRAFVENRYPTPYSQTARVACALAGQLPRETVRDTEIAVVQARLNIAGHFCGRVDGVLGPKTIEALQAVGVTYRSSQKPVALLAELADKNIGDEAIKEL